MIVVLAEKPSVASDIAKVVGATSRRDGWWEGGGYQVTWAVGHLVGLAQPAEIRPEWGSWDPAQLPMLPPEFPLRALEGTEDRLHCVAKLFNAKSTTEIVCATDAGREGELIFRLIYELVGCRKPARRLWISSLTPDAIAQGLRAAKPAGAYDALASAARIRAEADWLVGMNLSRACSLATGERFHVGRVKTPTLAMVVARDIAIRLFEPEPYLEVEGLFAASGGEFRATYVRQSYNEEGKPVWEPRLKPLDAGPQPPAEDAKQILARLQGGVPSLASVEATRAAKRAPELFDLTELQRTANRLWGWTATKTLAVAQELYEQHKALSYPRTDSRHLSETVAATLPQILEALRSVYGDLIPAADARLGKRFVNDAEVSDHHALIPTGTVPKAAAGSDPALLFDVVCRRLLAAYQPDAVDATTKVVLAVSSSDGTVDRYHVDALVCEIRGWRDVDLPAKLQSSRDEAKLPKGLRTGGDVRLVLGRLVPKETRAPAAFTEATLLSAMEFAGSGLGKELSKAMKDRGLGTPATRARTIEDLVKGGYLVRDGKMLRSTPLGALLVSSVHPDVASPAMTGEWECQLRLVERGELNARELDRGVRKFVAEAVKAALANGVAPRRAPTDQKRNAPKAVARKQKHRTATGAK